MTNHPVFDAQQFKASVKEAGLSIPDLCKSTKVHKGNLYQAMKGDRGIEHDTCRKLAKGLPGTPFAATWLGNAGGAATPAENQTPDGHRTIMVPLDLLDANTDNTRKTIDPDKIAELADSIAARGLIQNVAVRATDDGRFMIVAGDRRRLAFLKLRDEGRWPKAFPEFDIPAKLRDGTREELLADTIVENLARVNVPPMEEAEGFKDLRDMGWTTQRIAKALGNADDKGKRRIQQYLQIANGLVDKGKDAIRAGSLTLEQGRALASLPAHLQEMMLRREHSSLPKTESLMRTEAVHGYARIEDMAFGIKAYNAQKGASVRLGTGTYLLDTGIAEELQREAAARLVKECHDQGYAEVQFKDGMYPDVVMGDDTLDPKDARAIVYIKPRDHQKGVGQITVVTGLPLKSDTRPGGKTSPLSTEPNGTPDDTADGNAPASARHKYPTSPPAITEIIAAVDHLHTAAVNADAAFADVLLVRDNAQSHAIAVNYEQARTAQADALLALRTLMQGAAS
ncbi:ParB/RepB/Spo0J family partition protein [Pyruvatibacter sp.]